MDTIIGRNFSFLRKKNCLSVSDVAQYLGMTPADYSALEEGSREASVTDLEKGSSLFGCPGIMFYEDDVKVVGNSMLKFAFDGASTNCSDLETIAHFKSIFMNYLKMKKLSSK